tara:strand:- start:2990 stop:3241 length:252 start_codon:yes stop_codon:yes gene_type:complete
MQKTTMFRVDSTIGNAPVYLPTLGLARYFSKFNGWLLEERTAKVQIRHKGQLSLLLCGDAYTKRVLGDFLQQHAYFNDGERYE